jgi:MFS family permease
MALGPPLGGWIFDRFGSYGWLYIGSFGIGWGAVAIALLFRSAPPRPVPALAAAAGITSRADRGRAERAGA